MYEILTFNYIVVYLVMLGMTFYLLKHIFGCLVILGMAFYPLNYTSVYLVIGWVRHFMPLITLLVVWLFWVWHFSPLITSQSLSVKGPKALHPLKCSVGFQGNCRRRRNSHAVDIKENDHLFI